MAADDNSSPDSETSGVPGWLKFLGVAGAVGGVVGLALYAEKQQKRQVADLLDSFSRLRAQDHEKLVEHLVTAASDEVSEKIEVRIEERVGRRLDAADARFNQRIDQISDSGAAAVEQLLRETNRRSEEFMRKAESRLNHIGWLGEEVAPAADSGQASTVEDDPVWTELGDFQRQFES